MLDRMLDQGWSDATIGRRLGRTAVAVHIRVKRLGLESRTARTLNARKVAALLGVSCSKTVSRWVERGWLRGRRQMHRGPNRQWLFSEDALLEFMRDPRTWPAWSPGLIADACLREWAEEVRRERYLSVGEVAQRYSVGAGTVGSWLDNGLLPSIRYGNRWVPESALRGFVAPCERSRAGLHHRRWTAHEAGRLRDLRVAGLPFVAIAAELDRSLGSVANRWYRMAVAS